MAQLDVEIDKGVRDVKRAVRATLRYLHAISPVLTGWYRYNHRVLGSGVGSVELDPPTRPSRAITAETLFISAAGLVRRENAVINEFKLGDSISLINAVPYADKIENEGTTTTPTGMYYARADQYLSELLGRPLGRGNAISQDDD